MNTFVVNMFLQCTHPMFTCLQCTHSLFMCLQVTTDNGEVKKGEMVVDPLTDPDPKCVAMDSLRQQVSYSMDSWLLRATPG